MILPPTEISPPTLGANTSVAVLPPLPATRSGSDTANDVKDTRSPIGPLSNVATPTSFASCDVVTLIEFKTLDIALPIVTPLKVTVKAVEADTLPSCTVSKRKVAACEVQLISALLLVETKSKGDVRKKFEG